MKRMSMKKAAAVLLSAAMAFSVPAVSRPVQAEASASVPKYVKLNTTFKTMRVGQKDYRLHLINNKISWKVKKVTVSDKSVTAAYGKTSDAVLLKAKKEGRATVTLRLETAKRKKNAVKRVKCTVKVVPAPVPSVPDVPQQPTEPVTPAAVKDMTVSSQTELEAALSNASLETLSIRTDNPVNLKIPAGSYPNVTLTVDAPNADIENSATFKSITIRAIKEDTWLEKAIGNNLQIEAIKARVVVDHGARVETVNFTSADADIKLVVNGAVSSVAVSATIKLEISGSTVNIPVIIGVNAGSTELTTFVPVSVLTEADANIILNKGAEGSTVKANVRTITVKLKNSTDKSVEVEKADGTKQSVSRGSSTTVTPTNNPSSGSYVPGSSTGSSSSSSSSSGSSSSGNTVKHTLPTFTVKASTRIDSTTMGALLIDKNDIHFDGCVSPQIVKMQWSGHYGEDRYDYEEDENGIYIDKTDMLGSNYLEDTIEMGRGSWLFMTVQDQGTEYEGVVPMNYGQIVQAGNVKTFEGVLKKKSSITCSFDIEIISGSAIAAAPDKGWIRATIPYASVKFEGGVSPKLVSGLNYDNQTNMRFSLVAEEEDQRWMSEKNGGVTYEELVEKVQDGIRDDRKFLYMTFTFTDNGKTYTATVSTSYRDFFGDDPEHFGEGKHSYSTVLYETES